mmetsp:Transcript_96838/g.141650  ORF Transcript_96838/g.141650 Transcript_96838/m.141650 type:complete len:168 (+) Transcript_96838:58-561(+)
MAESSGTAHMPAVDSASTGLEVRVDGHDLSAIELVEEFGLFAMVAAAVLFFLYRRTKTIVQNAAFDASVSKREDSMRTVREMQQARYEIETADKRENLARIAEEQRMKKLEEMEAMAEGRTAKHKKDQKKGRTDTRDIWDQVDGFSHLNGGGGSSSFKPTCRKRGGG